MKSVSTLPVIVKNLEQYKKHSLLLSHISHYPNLCWVDIYKCILQGTCGWQHLSKKSNIELIYKSLIEEFQNVKAKNEKIFELLEVETQIVRVNLKAWKYYQLPITELWNAMVKVDINPKNGLKLFKKRWKELINWFDKGIFQTQAKEEHLTVNEWLKEVEQQVINTDSSNNLIVAHHSQLFRENYKPSYRLALKRDIEYILKHRLPFDAIGGGDENY